MRLLNVKAVLDREKDIQRADREIEVLEKLDDETTCYAILSHRWGNEVNYDEMAGLAEMGEWKRDKVRQRGGYQKIIRTCEQAMRDAYMWLWVDTCCIDKRSSAELSEAINSMYRWYQNSQKCYAYLNDVDEPTFLIGQNISKFGKSNGWPEWFVRGWTLQELIAPRKVEFFNKNWVSMGTKGSLAEALQEITGIPRKVLRGGLPVRHFCVTQIMSWAADRQTTRVEDRAYSLMGLFGVNMPMLYGEGKKAFQRLQLEIMRVSCDHSIFAWDPFGRIQRPGNVLADDPSYFRDCHHIERVEPAKFVAELTRYTRQELGISPLKNITHRRKLASWRVALHSQPFRTISVTNAGIEVWLPVIPYRGSPSTFRAAVARHGPGLITVDLAFHGSSFERSFDTIGICKAYPAFKALCLTYSQETDETLHDLRLDDRHASYLGFTRCGTFPREITGNTVLLSSHASDLIVVVYANSAARSRFALGLGHYFNHGWVHVTCDECSINQEEIWIPWADFAKKAYDMMWNARAYHAQQGIRAYQYNENSVKHAHLPRSIWDAKVVWGRWNTGNLTVMVDVEQCPGCCIGPFAETATFNDRDSLDMPGFMTTVLRSHLLSLDGKFVWLHECSPGIVLGDYGDCSGGNFERHGNIFEDIQALGIDPKNPAYHPVEYRFSGAFYEHLAMKILKCNDNMTLSRPIGFSLPNSQVLVLLLKALSTRLSGKHLVITAIRNPVDDGGEMRQGQGREPVLDNSSCSIEPSNFISLCTFASPQVWRRQSACVQRKEQFREIREYFFALVNPHRSAGIKCRFELVNGETDRAIEFFSKAFGLEYLRNYVGEITFLKGSPLKLETESRREVRGGNFQRNDISTRPSKPFINWAMKCNPFKDRHQSNALGAERSAPRRYAAEKRKTEREANSISQTLSIQLLEHICTTFAHADPQNSQGWSEVDYDRQLDIDTMVQEIKKLQAQLEATEDEDEQRALEEDVTGKILWLYWCGICSEVDHLLPKVVDYIGREGGVVGLRCIGRTVKGTLHTVTDDDQAHLLRIMADAGVGTSKHRLWLAARDEQRINTSGTTVAGDKFNLDTPPAIKLPPHH